MFFSKITKVQSVLDKFGKIIDADRTRCVQLRAKNSVVCKDCLSVCPSFAISVTSNDVVIDSEKCTECGICCKACKTGVFTHKNFKEYDFYNKLSVQSGKQGHVVISCLKCNTPNQKNILSVPCLGCVDTVALMWSIACGAKKIHLHYNDCAKCETGGGVDAVTHEIENTKKTLGSFLSRNDIELFVTDQIYQPTSDIEQLPSNDEAITRRELFGYFKKRTKNSIAQALNYISETNEVHLPPPGAVIKSKIELPPKKRYFTRAIKEIFPHLDESANILESKYAGIVLIDGDKCNLCGVCYKLCPTGALKEITRINDQGFSQKVGISLHLNECLKCNLCIELCTAKAVSYQSGFTLDEYVKLQETNIEYVPTF